MGEEIVWRCRNCGKQFDDLLEDTARGEPDTDADVGEAIICPECRGSVGFEGEDEISEELNDAIQGGGGEE